MKINETSIYERLYRRFHKTIVVSHYIIQFTRFHYWRMMADPVGVRILEDSNVGKDRILERIDIYDFDEIGYGIARCLKAPGLRMYMVYSNGAKRRIKLCRFRG